MVMKLDMDSNPTLQCRACMHLGDKKAVLQQTVLHARRPAGTSRWKRATMSRSMMSFDQNVMYMIAILLCDTQ